MKFRLIIILIYTCSSIFQSPRLLADSGANVHFEFSEEVLSKGKIDVILSVYSDFVSQNIETYDYTKKIRVTDSQLDIDLPLEADLSFLTVNVLIDKEYYFFEPNSCLFLLEKSDSLRWNIDKEAKLSENGSQKNIVRERLFKHHQSNNFSWMDQYLNWDKADRYFEIKNEYFDALIALKIAYLDQLNKEHQLSDKIYTFIKEECLYGVEDRRVDELIISMKKNKERREKTNPYLRSELEKIKERLWKVNSRNPSVLKLFVDLVTLEERLSHEFVVSSKDHMPPDINIFHDIISTIPSQEIRDRMYPIIYQRFVTGSVNGREAISKVIDNISDQKYKEYMSKIKEIRYSYADVYPFQMHDWSGKIYTPESFKGKKVVFDFWFTGCIWCSRLHPFMVDFEKSINDPNILFVTVNVDTNTDKWKKGLDKGIYTEKDGLNLRLTDQGRDMLEYYGYIGFPRIMVMDDQGQLLEFNVPIPVNDAKAEIFRSILYSKGGADRFLEHD